MLIEISKVRFFNHDQSYDKYIVNCLFLDKLSHVGARHSYLWNLYAHSGTHNIQLSNPPNKRRIWKIFNLHGSF